MLARTASIQARDGVLGSSPAAASADWPSAALLSPASVRSPEASPAGSTEDPGTAPSALAPDSSVAAEPSASAASASRAAFSAARRARRSANVSFRASAALAVARSAPSLAAGASASASSSAAAAFFDVAGALAAAAMGSMTSDWTTDVTFSCVSRNWRRARPMVRPICGSLSGPKSRKAKTTMIMSSVCPIPNTRTSWISIHSGAWQAGAPPSTAPRRITAKYSAALPRKAAPNKALTER